MTCIGGLMEETVGHMFFPLRPETYARYVDATRIGPHYFFIVPCRSVWGSSRDGPWPCFT